MIGVVGNENISVIINGNTDWMSKLG